MESRWMSGCVRSVVHNIPAHYLASSTNIFSETFISRLGDDLESNKEQLARELGFSMTHSATDGLFNWCNNTGSTVFVLVSVLGNMCRADCIQRIEQYIQSQTIQLFVKVDEAVTDGQKTPAAPKFHQIITCCEFSLLKVLENVLGSDLVYYEIVGPGDWVMWTTQAKELKGQQLNLLYHSQPVSSTRSALCDPMEQETELKQPVVTHNLPANSTAEIDEETHLKVLECTQIENLKYSHEPSIQESNSNNLMLSDSLDKDIKIPRSVSVEGPTKTYSRLSVDSKNYQFSLHGQTHVKTLAVGRQNTPEYVQVIKYFPDKLLYEESSGKRNNQCVEANQAHPLQVLDNVPRLSLLEDDLSSLLPNAQRSFAQPAQENRQCKLNDLSCVVPSFGRHSVDFQTFPKTSAHENVKYTSVPRPADNLTLVESSRNIPTGLDLTAQIPVLSEINLSELCMSCAASSLFAPGHNAQVFDTPMSCAENGYLPHTCVKTVGDHFENCGRTAENNNPMPCGNYDLVSPPHINHKLNQSSLTSAEQHLEHHHQVQQQSLLDVAEMRSRQLRLQKLQRQQALTLPQISPLNSDLESPTDCNSRNFLPQEIFHQDSEVYQEPQQHRSDRRNNSSNEHLQTMNHNHQETGHQTFHLSDVSQQQENNQQLYSQHNVQSSTSPFIKPNASPYLMCHTPPPGFPDEQNNHHLVSEDKGKYIHPQGGNSLSSTEEFSQSSQFPDKLSQMTNMDTGSEQYMAMFQPSAHDMADSSFKASSVRPQSSLGHFSTPQNMAFTNNILPAQNTSQNPRNQIKSVISSDSSGGSSECPVFIYSKPFTVFAEGQRSFMTPKPFHPAPLLFDALGRQIHASMPNDHNVFRTAFGETGQSHQESCCPPSRGQFTRSKSLPINHFQATSMMHTQSMEVEPHVENLEAELLSLEGWCPNVNGDTIEGTMEKFKSLDGNYIIWKSRRHKKFIISVSYLNQLFHFRVEEVTSQSSERTVYFLFEGGYSSPSFLDLIQHYRQSGIRISMQSAGKNKTYIENIHLLCPLKMKAQMTRKGTSKSK